MALVNCAECGKQISDQAPACPQCGRPRQTPAVLTGQTAQRPPRETTLTKPAGVFLQLVGFFVVLVGIGVAVSSDVGQISLGLLMVAGGVWMVIAGRRPAVRR